MSARALSLRWKLGGEKALSLKRGHGYPRGAEEDPKHTQDTHSGEGSPAPAAPSLWEHLRGGSPGRHSLAQASDVRASG